MVFSAQTKATISYSKQKLNRRWSLVRILPFSGAIKHFQVLSALERLTIPYFEFSPRLISPVFRNFWPLWNFRICNPFLFKSQNHSFCTSWKVLKRAKILFLCYGCFRDPAISATSLFFQSKRLVEHRFLYKHLLKLKSLHLKSLKRPGKFENSIDQMG